MAKQAVIDRLTKLGEQTVSQAAEALSKNKALQDKLETVVKSGLAVKDEVEGNVKVVIDRFNLKNAVDLDGIKTRLDTLETDIEGLLGDLSARVSELTNRVTDLRSRVSGAPVNDDVVVAPVVEPAPAPVVEAAAETTLSGLTVKALRALAAERNIEVPNRIRKADLIALIEAA
jgi:uncharacterized protein YqgV (UPF0045/DUF77 family)